MQTEQPWVFGYGSLIWRPAFPFETACAAYVSGWARRFWQGSTDHRGVPGSPGRVVTLIPDPGGQCWGMAYQLSPTSADAVLAQLDVREQGGYARILQPLQLADGRVVPGLMYRALPGNPNDLGPASLEDIAAQVVASSGPSGSNIEYLLRLDEALHDIGAEDVHVSALAARVRALLRG